MVRVVEAGPAGYSEMEQLEEAGEWDSGRWEGLELPVRAEGGWDSLVETAAAAAGPSSPLWQRRILMGERCEQPHPLRREGLLAAGGLLGGRVVLAR